MGSVWVAEQTRLGGLVAVKFLSTALLDHESARTRFDREARIAAKIKSQHVVQVHDHGVTRSDPAIPYIVMELLEGVDLSKVLEREGPLGLARTCELVDQIADALTKAHDAGIVHRDIKPENVFVLDEAKTFIKLLDFGVAHGGDGQLDRLTQTGLLLGTAHYMSPEQLFSGKDIDPRADLWALGVLTYQILTNEVPFQAETFGQLCLQVRDGSFAPASSKVNVPPGVDEWFTKALSTDRAGRFGTASEMADAFRRVVEGGLLTDGRAPVVSPTQTAGTGTVKVSKSGVSRLRGELESSRARADSAARSWSPEAAPPATQRLGSQGGFSSGSTREASEEELRNMAVSSGSRSSPKHPNASSEPGRPVASNTPLADLSGSFGTEAKGVLAVNAQNSGARSSNKPLWVGWLVAALALSVGAVYLTIRGGDAQPEGEAADGSTAETQPAVAASVIAEVVEPVARELPAEASRSDSISPPNTTSESIAQKATVEGEAASTASENTVLGRGVPSALGSPGLSSARGLKPSGVSKTPNSNTHAPSPELATASPVPAPAPHAVPQVKAKTKYRGF